MGPQDRYSSTIFQPQISTIQNSNQPHQQQMITIIPVNKMQLQPCYAQFNSLRQLFQQKFGLNPDSELIVKVEKKYLSSILFLLFGDQNSLKKELNRKLFEKSVKQQSRLKIYQLLEKIDSKKLLSQTQQNKFANHVRENLEQINTNQNVIKQCEEIFNLLQLTLFRKSKKVYLKIPLLCLWGFNQETNLGIVGLQEQFQPFIFIYFFETIKDFDHSQADQILKFIEIEKQLKQGQKITYNKIKEPAIEKINNHQKNNSPPNQMDNFEKMIKIESPKNKQQVKLQSEKLPQNTSRLVSLQQNSNESTNATKNKQSHQALYSLRQLHSILVAKNKKYFLDRHPKHEGKELLKRIGVDTTKIRFDLNFEPCVKKVIDTRNSISRLATLDNTLRQTACSSNIFNKKQCNNKTQSRQQIEQKINQRFSKGNELQLKEIKTLRNNKNHLSKSINDPSCHFIDNQQAKSKINLKNQEFTGIETKKTKCLDYQKLSRSLIVSDDQIETKIQEKDIEGYFGFVQNIINKGFENGISSTNFQNDPLLGLVQNHIRILYLQIKMFKQDNENESTHQQTQILNPEYQIEKQISSQLMIQSLQRVINYGFSQIVHLDDDRKIQKLLSYIDQLQKNNLDLKVWRNQKGQPIWALTFMLFMMGELQKMELFSLQNQQTQYLHYLRQYHYWPYFDKSSQNKYNHKKYNDSFYQQLTHLLNHDLCYVPQITSISDEFQVFVILQMLGIRRDKPGIQLMFQKVIRDMYLRQKSIRRMISKRLVMKFCYLGAYKQLIALVDESPFNPFSNTTNKSEFTIHQWFHFLIFVCYHPQLLGVIKKEEKQKIQIYFSNNLIRYILKVRTLNYQKIIPTYLLLSPPELITEVACSVISTRQEFSQFNWKLFEQLMIKRDQYNGKKVFTQVKIQVLNNLIKMTFNDLVFAADKYRMLSHIDGEMIFNQQKIYVLILLKNQYFHLKRKHLIANPKSQNELNKFNTQLFSYHQTNQNSRFLQLREHQISSKINQIDKRLSSELMLQHINNQRYRREVLIPFHLFKEINQLSNVLSDPNPSTNTLNSRSQIWSDSYLDTKLIVDLIYFLHNQSSQTSLLFLFVAYLVGMVEKYKKLCVLQGAYQQFYHYILAMIQHLNLIEKMHASKLKNANSQKISYHFKTINNTQNSLMENYSDYIQFKNELLPLLTSYPN